MQHTYLAQTTSATLQFITRCTHKAAIVGTLTSSFLFMPVLGQAEIHVKTTDSCGNYAAKAVYQFRSQQAASCGFSGARWNEDGKGQHHWCRTVRPSIAENETKARAQELMKCLNHSSSYNPNDFSLDVNTLNYELRSAANRGATERMQQLIAAGADFNDLKSDLMVNALNSKHYKTVNFLRKMGIPLSAEGKNVLNRFMGNNYDPDLTMLKWLLKNGVNPNHTDSSGATPLKDAISNNNTQAVAALLQYRANPNLDIKGGNCTTVMPLDYAVDKGNENIIAQLRRAGARTQAQCGG